MNIKFNVRGIEEFQAFLKALPRGGVRVALKAFTEYVIGNEQHGLKHNEPYKYVSRKSAYGFTFFTDKQRRWFWANGGPDMIGNNRTGESSKLWQYVAVTDCQYRITNPTRAAYFTRSNTGQARQPAKVGWRKTLAVVTSNLAGGIRAANAALNAWIKSKGR